MNCNSDWLQYHVSVPWFIINYDYSFSMNGTFIDKFSQCSLSQSQWLTLATHRHEHGAWLSYGILKYVLSIFIIYTQEYINIYCIVIVRKTCFALDLHMCSISVFAWLRDSVTLVPLRQEDGDELHHAVLRHQRCYLFVSSRLKWFRAPFVVIFWILFTNQPMLTDLTVTF